MKWVVKMSEQLQAEVKQLQEVVLNIANMLHSNQEALKQLQLDFVQLRKEIKPGYLYGND
jgi:peptidoglycan hydrolase CwlO-like protein